MNNFTKKLELKLWTTSLEKIKKEINLTQNRLISAAKTANFGTLIYFKFASVTLHFEIHSKTCFCCVSVINRLNLFSRSVAQ